MSVENWESIIHKNARTSDRADAGNVIDVEKDTIILELGPTAEYEIPKWRGSMELRFPCPFHSRI
jgi:hypothetical protein